MYKVVRYCNDETTTIATQIPDLATAELIQAALISVEKTGADFYIE